MIMNNSNNPTHTKQTVYHVQHLSLEGQVTREGTAAQSTFSELLASL